MDKEHRIPAPCKRSSKRTVVSSDPTIDRIRPFQNHCQHATIQPSMASHGDDDLSTSKTEGFTLGEKKTVEEYAKLGEYR